MRHHFSARSLLACALASGLLAAAPAPALEVWSGRTHVFTKPDGADWTLAENQDRITGHVWITRKNSQGLFNIAQEDGYSAGSPAGTEWATGNAADHASLSFLPWVQWAANNPPGTIGVDAVVHLIAEDIYLDIRFDSWTGAAGGGGFSYTRAVKPTASVPGASAAFALRGFVANPTRLGTALEFSLPDAAPARLEVLDVAGRLVTSREVGAYGAGTHRVTLDELRAQPPGLLFVRLTRAGRSLVARATHLR
jgi:hypothetical protein